MSSSADYGVSIAESFQPPENWVPGQEINKDAAATNTGNVDAFVRMYLTGNMRLLTQSKSVANTNAAWTSANSFSDKVAALTNVVDTNLLNANLTKLDNNNNYFKTLDKTQTINPKTSLSTNGSGYSGNESGTNAATGPYSEVQSMQSGILAYAPADAKYCYVLDEETELEVYVTSTDGNAASPTTAYKKVQVPAGTLVIADEGSERTAATIDGTSGLLVTVPGDKVVTSTSGATHTYTSRVYIKQPTADFVPQNVEYESFTPLTDGLYLFLRNESTVNQTNPEFSGYYVDGIDGTSETPATGTYYALNTGVGSATPAYKSDYTVRGTTSDGGTYDAPVQVTYDANSKNIIKAVPTTNLELFNAQYSDVASADLKWYYDGTNKRYVVLYDKDGSGTAGTFDEDTDVAVIINLANVGNSAEQWSDINGTSATSKVLNVKNYTTAPTQDIDATQLTTSDVLKFYYNNDLESGDTTAKLVDKVKLYEGVKNTAFLAFDFDLDVHLDSVQVTYDENGNESDTAVKSGQGETWKGTSTDGGATGARDNGTQKEINSVTWTKTT